MPESFSEITDEMIEKGAHALWKAHGTTPDTFWDEDERQAAWANACSDVEAVLEAVLGDA